MKNVMNNLKKYSVYLGVFFLAFGVYSCSDEDDDGVIEVPETNASISAESQIISQNTILVNDVEVDNESWLVARKVNEDGSFSEIISDPVLLEGGSHQDIVVQLDNVNAPDVNLEDGDRIILMLHEDDGDGTFEYMGNTGSDALITDSSGSAIEQTIEVTSPNFDISDQTVVDNTVTFDNISTNRDSWIVLHNQNAEGAIGEDDIVGRAFVGAGDNADVSVTFDEGFTYTPGQNLYSRLYLDDPADETFTYQEDPTTDMPETFGFGADGTVTNGIVIN